VAGAEPDGVIGMHQEQALVLSRARARSGGGAAASGIGGLLGFVRSESCNSLECHFRIEAIALRVLWRRS
jgi:hypothetical protein